MNNNERNENPVTSASEVSERLLRELMPKLGMEAKSPETRYRSKARMRYFLPRLAAVCAAVILLGALGIYLFTPAAFQDVTAGGDDQEATLDFSLSRSWLVDSVTAELDNVAVAVHQSDPGRYQIRVQRNGELTVNVRTVTGMESEKNVTVSSIDSEPPHLNGDEVTSGRMVIYFTDGDGSGIDWTSARAYYTDSEADLEDVRTDQRAGSVSFPFPAGGASVRISVADNCGNVTTVLLRVPEAAPASPTPSSNQEEQQEEQ